MTIPEITIHWQMIPIGLLGISWLLFTIFKREDSPATLVLGMISVALTIINVVFYAILGLCYLIPHIHIV